MPTQGHHIAQKWVMNSVVDWKNNGLVSKEEWRGLNTGFGTTLKLAVCAVKFINGTNEMNI
ncbi:hypothetical protein N7491_006298 [Penicillium cf. griseofulvum]|uniref:Uncharacterized protein n=1 Tax=Penicillium cf. griseofulvum TaxID=2972120 RepID=A0A9W9IXN9_9EURO|nr:hypothetical protein N7472_010672 [Penicillium cf. griseofulvum]KAJ5429282.1 hypothetical protein N7491_006298 [Penicillium cf. griseofulvum]KAJ5436924.1 hypothetical protein N7445_007809 [Penicillium cf. griseofulvum]